MKTLLLVTVIAFFSNAQDKSTIIVDERSGKPMVVGLSSREVFADTSFSWWFDSEYQNYEVDSASLDILELPENLSITIVMGTWCSDSRREVPRLYKILDFLNFPSEDVILIGVDRQKKGLEGEVTDLNIEFVPTFIFKIDDEESGRIVESPVESLEIDMVEILTE